MICLARSLLELAKTKDDAKVLVDVISAAEACLVVALAKVEGDEDPSDGRQS